MFNPDLKFFKTCDFCSESIISSRLLYSIHHVHVLTSGMSAVAVGLHLVILTHPVWLVLIEALQSYFSVASHILVHVLRRFIGSGLCTLHSNNVRLVTEFVITSQPSKCFKVASIIRGFVGIHEVGPSVVTDEGDVGQCGRISVFVGFWCRGGGTLANGRGGGECVWIAIFVRTWGRGWGFLWSTPGLDYSHWITKYVGLGCWS